MSHHGVVQEVTKSKAIVAHMGKSGPVLKTKIDALLAEMQKAAQLGEGVKKCEATMATLKKASDDQKKKLDDAEKANSGVLAKNGEEAKNLFKLAGKLLLNAKLKDSKNKATAEAINRIQFLADTVQKQKVDTIDSDTYQTQADEFLKYKKLLPKAGGDGLPSEDLKALNDRVDAMVKKLHDAVTIAKGADQIRHEYYLKNKAFDDMQKKVQPIEDALNKLIPKIVADLFAAKDDAMQYEVDERTPEAVRLSAAMAKVFNDASLDFTDGYMGKPLDAKVWATKP